MLTERQKKRINHFLEECSVFLEHGTFFLENEGTAPPCMSDHLPSFCRICLESAAAESSCRQHLIGAAYQGMHTGEPHYFRCWAGLNAVSFPCVSRGNLAGVFSTGGFLFSGERAEAELLANNALERFPSSLREKLQKAYRHIPEYSTLEIRGIADFIFEGLFSSGINNVDEFEEIHEKYLQQRRISERMQNPENGNSHNDTFSLFSTIGESAARGDRDHVMLLLDEFFSQIMLDTSLDCGSMKAHIYVLLAFLTREAVVRYERSFSASLARNLRDLRELEPLTELEDICYWTFRRVSSFLDTPTGDEGEPPVSRRVLDWLAQHFPEKVTRTRAAKEVGASISSISEHLKRDTNRGFYDHLLEFRLNEARVLLADTSDPIIGIATRCGFSDQSHFGRVFRRETGFTPRRYRLLAQDKTVDKE